MAYRVWHKGGLSKVDLALELLSYARNRRKCKPQLVLFDSWYPAQRLLKRIRDYGWYFVCQLKKNRTFDGVALSAYRQQPYWHAVGELSGRLKVLVVKHHRKYYVTNRLSLTAPEVRSHYTQRHEVEEVIRVLKSQLSLEACQVGYRRPGGSAVQYCTLRKKFRQEHGGGRLHVSCGWHVHLACATPSPSKNANVSLEETC